MAEDKMVDPLENKLLPDSAALRLQKVGLVDVPDFDKLVTDIFAVDFEIVENGF